MNTGTIAQRTRLFACSGASFVVPTLPRERAFEPLGQSL